MADDRYVPVIFRFQEDGSNKAVLGIIEKDIQKVTGGGAFRPIKLSIDVSDLKKGLSFTQQQQNALELARLQHTNRLAQIEAANQARLQQIRQQAAAREAAFEQARRARELAEEQRHQKRLAEIAAARNNRSTGDRLSSVGTGLTLGTGLAGGLTVGTAISSAIAADSDLTRLRALEGNLEKAEQRVLRLRALAQQTIGLTQTGVTQTFTFIQALGTVADTTAEKLIKGLGRLNAVFNVEDLNTFTRNLIQIFNQSFERADIKEAIGRVPIFEQLLESAFGTRDGAKLRKLKDSGQLTLNGFLTGLSDAIAKDPRLANITESIATRFDKLKDRVGVALIPLGKTIFDAIEPAINAVVPLIEKLGKDFADLPQPVRLGIVAIAGFGAGIGPALIAIGAISNGVSNLISLFATLGKSSTIASAVTAITSLNPAVLALTAVVAIGAIAWATYESAAEKAAKVSLQAINEQGEQLQLNKDLAGTAGGLTDAIARSAVEHEKFEAVLKGLNPATAAFIRALGDEQRALDKLNEELAKQVENSKGVLEATFRTLAAGFAENADKISEQERIIVEANKEINNTLNAGGSSLLKLLPGLARNYTAELSQGIVEARKNVKDFTTAQTESRDKLIQTGERLKLNRSQFEELAKSVVGNTGDLNALLAAYDRFKADQARVANQTGTTTSAIDQQRAAIERLKGAVTGLDIKAAKSELDSIVEEIAKNSKTVEEAKKKFRELRAQKDDSGRQVLDEAIKQQQTFIKNKKALEEGINPPRRSGSAGTKSEFARLNDELKEINKELALLQNVTGREFALRLKIEGKRDFARDLEEIVKLRRELGEIPNKALPETPFLAKGEIERLNALKDALNQLKKVDALQLFKENKAKEIQEQTDAFRRLSDEILSKSPEVKTATVEETVAKALLTEEYKKLTDAQRTLLLQDAKEIDQKIKLANSEKEFASIKDQLNGKLARAVDLNARQTLEIELQSGKYKDLTDAQRDQLTVIADQVDAQNLYNERIKESQEALKRLNETVVGAFQDLFERGPKAFFDNVLSLIKRSFARIAAELTGNVVTSLLGRLFGLTGPARAAGQNATAAAGGIDGVLQSVLFGGGRATGTSAVGAAVTPPFAGGAIPGVTGPGGGLLGAITNPGGGTSLFGSLINRIPLLRNVLNPSGGRAFGGGLQFTSGGGDTGAGTQFPTTLPAARPSLFAGLGASGLLLGGGLAGSLLGRRSAIGGLLGNIGGTLGLGALGATGIFGSGIASALPAFFSNPITAVIGGALLGGSLLFGLFADRTLNKFRDAVKAAHQVRVSKDQLGRQLFKESEQIGKQTFGGKWKDRMAEVVRLEPVKDRIAAYGMATNQDDSPLVREYRLRSELTDPNDSRNQIIVRRAFGGLVPGPDLRRDTVPALLRGLEFVSTPDVVRREGVGRFEALQANRATIVTDSEAGALRQIPPPKLAGQTTRLFPGSSQTQQNNGGQTIDTLLQVLIEMIGHFGQVMDKFEASPADAVLTKAIKRNPDVVTQGVESSLRARTTASNEIRNLIYSR